MYYSVSQDFSTYVEQLEAHTSDELVPLVKMLGATKVPHRKDDRVQLIVSALQGSNLQILIESMTPLERTAIAEVIHNDDGFFDEVRIGLKYADLPQRSKQYGWDADKNGCGPIDLLIYRDQMAKDLADRLRAFVPEPPEARIGTTTTPAEIEAKSQEERGFGPETKEVLGFYETEVLALHDVLAVLQLVGTGKISVGKTTGKATAASVRAVHQVLRDGDFIPLDDDDPPTEHMRAMAWPCILQAAKFARAVGTKLVLTDAGVAALNAPPEETLRSCWRAWLKTNLYDEFNRIDAVKGQGSKRNSRLTVPGSRRATICGALLKCPTGEWIEVDEFFRFLIADGHDFAIARYIWELSVANMGSEAFRANDPWLLLQGRYILCFFYEYAATMGLIDVATIPPEYARDDFADPEPEGCFMMLSRYDGLRFFRLNPLGAWMLDLDKSYSPPDSHKQSAFKLLPNHDVVITDIKTFPKGDLLVLEQLCKQQGDLVWKLDKKRILDVLEGGMGAERIRAFLENSAENDMPENLRQWLEDLFERAARVVECGEALLFEVSDHLTALTISNDRTLSKLCALAGERQLVVAKEKASAFRRGLKKLGHVARTS